MTENINELEDEFNKLLLEGLDEGSSENNEIQ